MLQFEFFFFPSVLISTTSCLVCQLTCWMFLIPSSHDKTVQNFYAFVPNFSPAATKSTEFFKVLIKLCWTQDNNDLFLRLSFGFVSRFCWVLCISCSSGGFRKGAPRLLTRCILWPSTNFAQNALFLLIFTLPPPSLFQNSGSATVL